MSRYEDDAPLIEDGDEDGLEDLVLPEIGDIESFGGLPPEVK